MNIQIRTNNSPGISFNILLLLIVFLVSISAAQANDDIEHVKKLGAYMCNLIADRGNQIAPSLDKAVTNHLKRNNHIAAPSKADKIRFLNKYNDLLTCDGKQEHYMKFTLDRRKWRDVFRKFFVTTLGRTKDGVHVDVNAVTLHRKEFHPGWEKLTGQPETLLDYLDFIVAADLYGKAYSKELKGLRRMLVKSFQAKKFSELPADVQAQYRKN